jgi:hypothetical protein
MQHTLRLGLVALSISFVGIAAAHVRSDSTLPRGTNPFVHYALQPGQRTAIHGVVRQRLDAGSYTYVRIASPGVADAWVVTLRRSLPAPLACVDATVYARAERFNSPRLHRVFAPLSFGLLSACR